MTHGYIWTPFIKDGVKMMLFSEAWSDGHVEYLGKMLLESSLKIDVISDLNLIFAGSPFVYNVAEDKFEAKQVDYIIEGYEDLELSEDLIESASETLELISAGDIESAKKTKFSLMSIDEKLELELGLNAHYLEEELAWLKFSDNALIITSKEDYNNLDLKNLYCTLEYYWKEDKFLTKLTDGKDLKIIVPLSFLL